MHKSKGKKKKKKHSDSDDSDSGGEGSDDGVDGRKARGGSDDDREDAGKAKKGSTDEPGKVLAPPAPEPRKSKSGRTVRGRGSLAFRTPPPRDGGRGRYGGRDRYDNRGGRDGGGTRARGRFERVDGRLKFIADDDQGRGDRQYGSRRDRRSIEWHQGVFLFCLL
eukprot:m.392783 g.392783  ORF g.392783 m.392783 type:complete len:165 (+) comp20088_c0_seq3:1306-1800(+)